MTSQPTPNATAATAVEAELWMALHDAMDGNLRVSRRRKLLADYKAAVLNAAASDASGAPAAAEQPSTGRTVPRRRLTEAEYSAAWHAIEGAAGEEGADPGTVLHAVLARLGIDTPAAAQTTG